MHPPRLALAAISLAFAMLCSQPTRAQSIATQSENGCATVTVDGRLVLKYYSQPHPYKLYVSELYTPSGIQVLRDSPHDHVHHHALMYAIGIDGVDFWAEFPDQKPAKQDSDNFSSGGSSNSSGVRVASIRQAINWKSSDQKVLAVEDRCITYHFDPGKDVAQLTWEFTLQPPQGKESVELWGRPYFGLGMRFVESMDKGGRFFSPSNEAATELRGTEQLVRAPWCAFTAKVDDKQVTIAMFADPKNPRHPATWFTMNAPFAYLAATLDLEREKLTISQENPLKASYGVAVWDGEIPHDQVESAYQQWLKR
jgi:hypothetical protein